MKIDFPVLKKRNKVTDALFSREICGFFYGIFLVLYEIVFFRSAHSPAHFLLIGWAGLTLLYDLLTARRFFKLPRCLFLLLFTLSVFVSVILNREAGMVDILKSAVLTLLPLYVFLPVCFVPGEKERLRRLTLVPSGAMLLFFIGTVISLVMFFLNYSDVTTANGVEKALGLAFVARGDGSYYLLLFGVFCDTNHAAVLSIVSLYYSAILLFAGEVTARPGINRALRAFALVNIPVQCLFFPLTNSRGGWLAFAFSLVPALALLLRKYDGNRAVLKRWLKAVLGTLLVLGVLLLLRTVLMKAVKGNPTQDPTAQSEIGFSKDDDGSGSGRLFIWKEALELYAHKPVFGEMPGTNAYYAGKFGMGGRYMVVGKAVHNSYLELLLAFGAVGTLLLLGYFLLRALTVLKGLIQDTSASAERCTAFGMTLAILAGGAFLSCFFTTTAVLYYFLLLPVGCLMAAEEERKAVTSHG